MAKRTKENKKLNQAKEIEINRKTHRKNMATITTRADNELSFNQSFESEGEENSTVGSPQVPLQTLNS